MCSYIIVLLCIIFVYSCKIAPLQLITLAKSFCLSSIMATVNNDGRLTSSQGFLCVGFAGVFSKIVTSPLEVVKIKSQIGTFHCKCGFLSSFRLIHQNEGLRAFWKGNYASCLRLFPYSAIHLCAYKT